MSDEHVIVISADGHCGADVWGYKPYLENEYHEEFDAWASTYSDPWDIVDSAAQDPDVRVGVASFGSSANWDSAKRLALSEENGIAAEVLFPNTAPPFFPSGAVTAHTPGSAVDLDRRAAGLRAHNRWLADFCAEAPGRRGGIAQTFLTDVDAAIEEVRWAKNNGLAGVLLPSDTMLALSNLYYPRLDPFWAACAELDMPVIRHGVVPSEAASPEVGPAAPLIGFAEIQFFTHRPLTHLILSGVFDRHPALKLVFTENFGGMRCLPLVNLLDMLVTEARSDRTIVSLYAHDLACGLKKLPTEYFRDHVYHGSFMIDYDINNRDKIGVDRMMFGADLPHHEGTHPYTQEALRFNLSTLSDYEIRAITHDTAIEVYGFDRKILQPVADRVCPTMAEIRTAGSYEGISEDAQMFCPTFQGDRHSKRFESQLT